MGTVRTNNVQVGQSVTATNNFTLYQPTVPDGTVRLGVGNTGATTLDAVTVTNAGNVGIGTSSPSTYANGAAPTLVVGTGNNWVVAQPRTDGPSGAGNGVRLAGNYATNPKPGAAVWFGAQGGAGQRGMITLSTKDTDDNTNEPTERARIDSSGSLLVNTTTSNSNAFKFKVQSTTDICLGVASATTVAGALTFNAINDANSANVPLDFRASSIHASSGIATTANAANANFSAGENNKFYRSTSALKYKQDIRDLESIDINRFRPVRYKSKCEDDDQTKDHFGIIADEVHAAGLTELVTYGVGQEVEGFQYERLTVVLLKAIQELTAKVAALEERLASTGQTGQNPV